MDRDVISGGGLSYEHKSRNIVVECVRACVRLHQKRVVSTRLPPKKKRNVHDGDERSDIEGELIKEWGLFILSLAMN